jgi:polyvinyl alcohol dehydrogenase (cytochrome)
MPRRAAARRSIGELAPPRKWPPPRSTATAGSTKGARRTKTKLTNAHLDVIKAPSAAFFGDDSGAVYALDAQKGTCCGRPRSIRIRWRASSARPRFITGACMWWCPPPNKARPRNAAYACCTFRGSVAALDMATGSVLWKTYAIAEEPRRPARARRRHPAVWPAGAAISGAPTVDIKRNLLYVGTGGSLTGANSR